VRFYTQKIPKSLKDLLKFFLKLRIDQGLQQLHVECFESTLFMIIITICYISLRNAMISMFYTKKRSTECKISLQLVPYGLPFFFKVLPLKTTDLQ